MPKKVNALDNLPSFYVSVVASFLLPHLVNDFETGVKHVMRTCSTTVRMQHLRFQSDSKTVHYFDAT